MEAKLMGVWQSVKETLSRITADAFLNVLGSLAMLFVGLFLIKKVMRFVNPLLDRLKIEKGVITFFKSAVTLFLRAVLIIAVLINLGVPSTSFIAMVGSAGLAIGLALQGSLSNFAGGLMILIFHPFRVGHFIQAQNAEGIVQEIGLFYTTIQNYDKKIVVLPNGLLSNGVIANISDTRIRRINITVETLPDVNVKRVNEILAKQAESHENVLPSEGIEARLNQIASGRLVFVLRCFTLLPNYWTTMLDLNERVVDALNKNGIKLCPERLLLSEDKESDYRA